MQKLAVFSMLALVGVAFAFPGAYAAHCNGVITQVDGGTETLYIDDRSDGVGDINHWFYLEANDAEGLQSGGDNIILEDNALFIFSDPCFHSNPDLLLL